MKVLHVVAYFPPERMGGVGEVVAHLHRALLGAGHESQVWTSGRSDSDARVRRLAAGPLGFVLALARLAAAARGFDVLHCHHADAILLLLVLRMRAPRPRVLVTFHVGHREMGSAWRPYAIDGRRVGTGLAGWRYRQVTSRLHRAADAIALRLADRVSFISRSTARDVLGAARAGRARVVYNAVPAPCASAAAPAPEPMELLYVGTGGPRKRVRALPGILRRVRERLPGARLRIVGLERDAEPGLAQHFESLGLGDAVRFEGRLPSQALPRFYRAADVLVVPSIYEGLPMVILEAMACGVPCVATRVSGHPEAIEDGVNGLLVEPDAPAQLADACLRLLADPALRARFAEAARQRAADRFGIERQRDAYLAIYRELVQPGPGSG